MVLYFCRWRHVRLYYNVRILSAFKIYTTIIAINIIIYVIVGIGTQCTAVSFDNIILLLILDAAI